MAKIVVCVGTRPDFIKMAPVIMKLQDAKAEFKILHTGQHYTPDLDIYKEFPIRQPDHTISGLREEATHAKKTARIMVEAEQFFIDEKPDVVVVQGDTDHALACALAARKLRMMLAHVESGLRSDDWRMPEEHNRVMIDHISNILFAPTMQSIINLAQERVKGVITLTGNTIVDSLHNMKKHIKTSILEKPYALATFHREENVDERVNLRKIVDSIIKIRSKMKMNVVFPIHPRTEKNLVEFGLHSSLSRIKVMPPLPYKEFLSLLTSASVVLTDSGGVQEEACTLQVPCVVARESTDRPEAVAVGASTVSGLGPNNVLKCVNMMMSSSRDWPNPFDPFEDHNASGRIASFLIESIIKS